MQIMSYKEELDRACWLSAARNIHSSDDVPGKIPALIVANDNVAITLPSGDKSATLFPAPPPLPREEGVYTRGRGLLYPSYRTLCTVSMWQVTTIVKLWGDLSQKSFTTI